MIVSIDISYYPLTADYEPPIIDFIHRLRAVPGLEVATNELTTQVRGEYPTVMNGLRDAMEPSLRDGPTASFVVKILNVDVTPGGKVTL